MKEKATTIEVKINKNSPKIIEADFNSEDKLERLESTIKNGLVAFVEVGKALREIRDSKLYRKYQMTFEDYCPEQLGISYRRVCQLISASEVVENLIASIKHEQVVQVFPNQFTEGAIRPMTKLKPEIQVLVWLKLTSGRQIPKPGDIKAEVQRVIIAEELIEKNSLSISLEEFIKN